MTFVTDVSLFLLPVALLRTQKMPDLNNKSLPPNRYFIFLPLLRADFSLPYANFVKLVVVLVYAIPVLLIFVSQNQVDWKLGGITAAGQGLGAYLGARFASRGKNVQVWIYRLLLLVVFSAIIYLFRDEWLKLF